MTHSKKNLKEFELIKFSLMSFLKYNTFLCLDNTYILSTNNIKNFITLRRLLLSSVTSEVLYEINDIFNVTRTLAREMVGTHSILEYLSADAKEYGAVDVFYKEDRTWKDKEELSEIITHEETFF